MENQRSFLFIALFLTLTMLYMEWQKDYHPRPLPAAQIENAASQPAPTLDVPGVEAPSTDAASTDLAKPQVQTATAVKKPQGKSIRVQTDVYDLRIDTRGAVIDQLTLTQHPKSKKTPDDLVELFTRNEVETYLLNTGMTASWQGEQPTHLVEWKSAAETYSLDDGQDTLQVPFTWTSADGVTVSKTFNFSRNSFAFTIDYKIVNNSGKNVAVRPYAQLSRSHLPLSRSMFDVDSYSYKGPAWFDGEKYEKLKTKDLMDDAIDTEITSGWLATLEHHFLAAIVPAAGKPVKFTAKSKDENSYQLTAAAETLQVASGQSINVSQQFFAGPKIQKDLAAISEKLDLTTDYGVFSIISKPLFWLLSWVYGFIGNWGWAIVVVTLMIKAAFYPLTAKSARSMAAMKKIQPRIKLLQERYKDDRQKLSQATMDVYRKEKINPAAGCLPILIQFPFFLGFYWLLIESVELRQAPWMLWIQDLSSKDPLFILPVLYGVTMYLQQKVQPMSGGNPEMMRVMKFMPIAMVGLFSFFPAGLVLYWITNSAVTVVQQWRINSVIAKEK